MQKITEQYIAGFIDGEGCFSLIFRKDKKKYFYWRVSFAIELRGDDAELLKIINEYFGKGALYFSKTRNIVRYQISNTSELANIVVPFFEKNKLIGKKRLDFDLWKEAVLLIEKNKKKMPNAMAGVRGFFNSEWSTRDTNRLRNILLCMQKNKSGSRLVNNNKQL